MDRILLWAVQSQGQWRLISTELRPDRHRGRPPHPSQRSGDCSAITEEREVNWSRQHPSRTGPSRYRGRNDRPHDNLQQDLADMRTANPVDQSLVIALPKTGNLQQCQNYRTINLISYQSKVMLKIILTDWGLKRRRSLVKNRQASEQEGAPKSRYRQPKNPLWEVSPTPTRPPPCLHRL